MEEEHPEQNSERVRLSLRKTIHSTYARSPFDIHDLVLAILDINPNDDVLDVGCGLGDFLIKLRLSGHLGRLHGVDHSAELVDFARKEAMRNNCGIEFSVGEFNSLPFPSAGFNCLTAIDIFCETDPTQALAEIGRILKADGRVIISVNSRNCYPLLEELRKHAFERFGWFMTSGDQTGAFFSETAPDFLRKFFARVDEYRYENVLEYPDAEVLVDFFRSTRGFWADGINKSEWERIVDWARDEALELIPERGYAEDPVNFSIFKCAGPLGF